MAANKKIPQTKRKRPCGNINASAQQKMIIEMNYEKAPVKKQQQLQQIIIKFPCLRHSSKQTDFILQRR